MSDLTATLNERNSRYGDWLAQATISQNLQLVMRQSRNWTTMSPDKRESLLIIANKLSRILNGDPEYKDSWHDIAGYAKLIEDSL